MFTTLIQQLKINTVILKCECLHSTFVVERIDNAKINKENEWEESPSYSISFCDSCTDWGLNTFWKRLKAAWYVLAQRRNNHTDIYIEDESRMKNFVKELNELVDMGKSNE